MTSQILHPVAPANLDWLAPAMTGALLSEVRREDWTWRFSFDNGAELVTETYWRILAEGRLALGSEDHGQLFGRTETVDAVAFAWGLLSEAVTAIEVDGATGDLRVTFGERVLELLNTSTGHEGWRLSSRTPVAELIAMGGGEIAGAGTAAPA